MLKETFIKKQYLE